MSSDRPSRWTSFLDAFGAAWSEVEDVTAATARRLRKADGIEPTAWQVVGELAYAPHAGVIPAVKRRPYGHGAYMGAAPAMVADPKWRRILAFLMPDVYVPVTTAVERGVAPNGLIPMFENNPVMAAFGVWHGVRAQGESPVEGIEWDVFLDGARVRAWAAAVGDARAGLIAEIADTMVIAHASTTDTVQEQLGLDQWRDVRKTAKTALGGVTPLAWIDLFGRALTLADADDPLPMMESMAKEARISEGDACDRYTFADPWPWDRTIAVWTRLTGRPRFSVVLEIKSLRSTAALLVELVGELNRRGVHVAACGSFVDHEILGVAAMRQHVHGEDLPGPREVLFLHYAGDLQHAVLSGHLADGRAAMFNGASLLHVVDGDYLVDEAVVAELAELVRAHWLDVGLYVQEGDTDERAAQLLAELVARESHTFALGFAWGGLADQVALARGGGDHRGYGSQKVLGSLGRARKWTLGTGQAPGRG
jgi:hypothetical protein